MKSGRIFDARRFAVFGNGRVDAAAADHGVAAGERHLFKNNRIRAGFLGEDAGREAGAARADDDHVDRLVPLGGQLADVGRMRRRCNRSRRRCGSADKHLTTGNSHFVTPFLMNDR